MRQGKTMTPNLEKIFVSMPEDAEFGIARTSLTDSLHESVKKEYTAYYSQSSLIELLKGRIEGKKRDGHNLGCACCDACDEVSRLTEELQSLLSMIEKGE